MRNSKRIILLLPALIGLILASFATVPQANASLVSKTTPGAGYLASVSSGGITQVTAQWNQPAVTCQPSLAGSQAELAGIIIANSTGHGFFLTTAALCATGSAGSPGYGAAVIPLFPGPNGAPSPPTLLALVVSPGDKFSGSLTFSPSTETVTADLIDLSTGQSASATLPQPSTPFVFTVAFWVVIHGPDLLAEFNAPITFSHCSATVSGQTFTISQFATVMVVGGTTMSTTSRLSRHGSSFIVTWVSST